MRELWRHCSGRERRSFVGLAAFLALAVLFGGGSRSDVSSLPIVYVAAVLMVGAAILQFERGGWARVRTPLLLLGGLAAVMVLQLLPLPPTLWRALAGRETFAAGLEIVGLANVWRPASLTPDLTLYGFVALLVPLGVLLVGASAGRMLPAVVPVLLALCALSGFVGLLQIAGALPSFYRITNHGAAVGLFANRNHQAVLLVCALPLLAAWAAWPHIDPAARAVRRWIGLCAGAVLLPLLMVTGSRGGILFGMLAVFASVGVWWSSEDRRARSGRGRAPLMLGLLAAVALVPVIVTLFFARDLAVQRLLSGSEGELRTQLIPVFMRMISTFFPWGSGFGSFDAVFRSFEPHAALSQTYLNHAHNEVVELLIEGGLGAGLLAVAFVAWIARQSAFAWMGARGRETSLARAGSVVLVVVVLWSLVDYPLRTPSLAAVAAVACLMIRRSRRSVCEPGLGTRATIR